MVPKLSPILAVIEKHGFPSTLYISLADWATVRNFIKIESDEDGAFFWCMTTKVRVKRGEHVVDLSDQPIFSGAPPKEAPPEVTL